ncbi:cisplatin damage response ATP-dependent DNA ligase [Chelativorans sp. ZYF759]|uniref:cisplatin damage response ATP-dependent DNA ligase n=1 Tax=Chelativorans sp. ZYF759 TaxID=2692213 RepID=UPI00145DDD43|nr:cisplatin damage response ATP-dependent DNA ligase [Chelativorans sp. ZYF759]NMG41039.1 cisplatin damage response ATP-dependent DNA ligase [Chelativorans sp. ZYF759]
MDAFAQLLDRLVLASARNAKLALMRDYFSVTRDPDRGLALAALTGDLSFSSVKPAMLRTLITERMDPVLFAYSYDYVGDLAETVSLAWQQREGSRPNDRDISLADAVERLSSASRSDGPRVLEDLLDRMEAPARFAIIKLVTGGLRVGVSTGLAKQALAEMGGVHVHEIEELWHGLTPPYGELFAWLEGTGEKPVSAARAMFRPVMLSTATDLAELANVDPSEYSAEWKWDGIRVQAVSESGTRRLYSRTGDDISGTFPDVLEAMDFDAALDGELLVGTPPDHTGSFSDLQQRLNRKSVSDKQLKAFPAFVRCYDLLQEADEDLRPLPFVERRKRLEAFIGALGSPRFDLSPLVPFGNWEELEGLRTAPPHPVIEGVMLKRHDSRYLPGRPRGPWFKWKRDPHTVDAVLMYAQRGHGKRSSFYSDYTFGVWTGDAGQPELVPVGKAYFGFTDEELKQIDKFVRDNTIDRYGPVRAVRAEPGHGLVIEVAFEGLARSTRHKSGVAMRFPRVSRLRWDKPPHEADRLETLQAMLD